MIYEIKSDLLTVQINDAGAELHSVKGNDGHEYIWQGDERYWKDRAPLLFPTCGRLLENKRRHMSRSLFSSAMRLLYQRKFDPALKMLHACRLAENARGIYTLGCLYEFGIGTATDRELAFSLYEVAYSMKFRDPRQSYKQKILKMVR